jgi:ribonucleoside-diphosphate reductase alpha chain
MDSHLTLVAAQAADDIAPISRQIWDAKYRLKLADGAPVDLTIEDSWRRVARALAAAEAEPAKWEAPFYEALQGFRFLPAGRIMSGAGSDRRVTLFNCFVMGDIGDDLGSIFANLREAALTMQQGGGIGYDFSTLRPRGAPVRGVGADASGPLSFMDVWDSMCRTIMSAGARRGAMMATMRCDHPDIEDFIAAKREPGRLRNFNLSVLATDAFMAAVDGDTDWRLVFEGKTFRTIRARALFDSITRATYDYAEPGVIFIDRINARNNLHYCETIRSTNPCGEQPLPPYGACLLGSINLAKLVRDPFSETARVDAAELADLVGVAIRMMDNTIDISGFPLEEQRQEAVAKRRIGLGVTGLADALMMCGLRYGSVAAAERAGDWARQIERAAYLASAHLAREKGAFPLFDADAYLGGETVRALDSDIRALIGEHGIRNALLTSVAPTGTISLVADNVSSGIEPVFALEYTRKVREPDGSSREEEVSDHAVRLYRRMFGADATLPDHFVTAQDLTPAEHVRMQAAVQRHVDSAISKTVNVPETIGFAEFQEVYLDAYRSGCKGCTTYRPNAITGSVLSVASTAAPAPVVTAAPSQELLVRADKLVGATYKLRWPDSEHAMYVTINDIEQDGLRRPFEIFVNSKNLEHYAWVVALTRMISAVFRRGGEVAFVAEELKQVFDPRGGQFSKGRYVPSLVAAIGDVIERHMIETGFLVRLDVPAEHVSHGPAQSAPSGHVGPLCPRCSQPGLVKEEGCLSCMHCGWSKCG